VVRSAGPGATLSLLSGVLGPPRTAPPCAFPLTQGWGCTAMAPGGSGKVPLHHFGPGFTAKVAALSFVTGACMELFMVKTGFYEKCGPYC